MSNKISEVANFVFSFSTFYKFQLGLLFGNISCLRINLASQYSKNSDALFCMHLVAIQNDRRLFLSYIDFSSLQNKIKISGLFSQFLFTSNFSFRLHLYYGEVQFEVHVYSCYAAVHCQSKVFTLTDPNGYH